MAHMLPRNAQADGWERSDFPIVCESCLGGNPYVRMTRADCDKECKICMRLFTVFGWKLGSDASHKITEICQSCSKLKNVCQVCLLDLEYGLPVQVRDSALSINSNDAIPKSDVNHEYFTEEDDRLGVHKISTRTAQIRLVSSHPEVYEPCDDSFVLVDALLSDRLKLIEHQPKICLEIGCGSGYVIASLALMLSQDVSGIQYFATDINLHATETTRQTLEAHGIHVEVIATDIASGLHRRLAGMVDVVVVNPPYVPTPEEEVGCEGITASWAGGENGRRVIDRILPVVNELLSERGWLYMVTLTANNPSQICRLMREKGYASKIVLQRSTQEESLHVVKFWRNAAADETKEGNKGVPSGSESWLSQFSLFSFLTGNQNSS